MPDAWQRVSEVLREQEEEAVRFLQQLVQADTQVLGHGITGGREAAGQELIRARLERLGALPDVFEPEEDRLQRYGLGNEGHNYAGRPNVVARFPGVGGGRSIILNGHVDTMPPGDPAAWPYPPWSGVVERGRLYGLGAADMKAGLAGLLLAAEAVRRAGVRLKGDLIFESVVDEEGGGNGTLACLDRGYRADGAVIAEPTHLEVQPAHMGFIFYAVRVEGKPLHSSRKWAGVSAVEKAIKLIQALNELEHRWLLTRRHPLLPGPSINVGEIHGGEAGSTVPGWCEFKLCLHYLPDGPEAGRRTEREVLAALEDCARGDPWLREHPPKIEKYQEGSPFEVPVDHPLVQTTARAVEAENGAPVRVSGKPAGCDARYFTALARIPCVILGPGEPEQAHSVGESVDVQEYLTFIRIAARLILDWCGVAE
ncbi:MAG: acetylornithine deacetylase [Bacillota bacterium]|jgi:acetylornithine deacetylase|nr:acetylornithine deacetylase [Bacillota bacterium]